MIQYLCDQGADMHARNYEDATPFLAAYYCANFQIVKYWINIYDKTRTSLRFPESNSVIWMVADSLIEFWKQNSSAEIQSYTCIVVQQQSLYWI